MENFKQGDILIYRDKVYKKEWRVIMLHQHDKWPEYLVCYVIEAPEEDKEDLNTIMNLPVFFLDKDAGYPLAHKPRARRSHV